MGNGVLFYGHKIDLKQLQEAFATLCDKYNIDVEVLRRPYDRAAIKLFKSVIVKGNRYAYARTDDESHDTEHGHAADDASADDVEEDEARREGDLYLEAEEAINEALDAITNALSESCSISVSRDGQCCNTIVDSFFIGLSISTLSREERSVELELPSLEQTDQIVIDLSCLGLGDPRYHMIMDDCDSCT